MTYIHGFIVPVPSENKETYRAFSADLAPRFRALGALRNVEAWGDDLPEGKMTDFRKSVNAEEGEGVVFAWLEYPDRATYDSANAKMRSDAPSPGTGDMPFDGKRMIFGGFDAFVDEGSGGKGAYTDGFVLPVLEGKRQAYHDMASEAAAKFRQHGALRVVEAWGDDVPDGKVTDFRRSVKAKAGEAVVFSFIEWPDKATRDQAWAKIMVDPDMQPPADMPFDGKRMFWGGFETIVDA